MILIVLFGLGVCFNVVAHFAPDFWNFYDDYWIPRFCCYLVLALLMIPDLVNAFCVQSYCWFMTSAIIWVGVAMKRRFHLSGNFRLSSS